MQKRTWLGMFTGAVMAAALISRSRRFDWRNKVVVVTGGARGLGLVLARELIRRGSAVAICARDPDEVERARAELAASGGRVFALACDLTERGDLTGFLSLVEETLGPVEVLINSAGVIQVGPMEMMTVEDFDAAMRIHFWAPLHATLAVLPGMRRRKEGRIINITSIGAKVPVPHLLPYAASKFALYGLSTGMRTELAKDGVVVTTVCPGLMRTGSPRQALLKGRQEAEYGWFKLASNLPVITMKAERAARQILEASECGDAEVVLSLPAKVLAKVYGLAPSFVQNVMGAVSRASPSAEGGSVESIKGKDAERSAPELFKRIGQAQAQRNNEM